MNYSKHGLSFTIDSTSFYLNDSYKYFLRDKNEFAVNNNGMPILTQTLELTKDIINKCYTKEELDIFRKYIKQKDPTHLFLNDYYKELFF
jgi:hypothetical protein